jgi:uncharacterized protein
MAGDLLEVELVYAGPAAQVCLNLRVPFGTTLRGVIDRSRILERCPEIDLSHWRVGVFGELRQLDEMVGAGARVEIYQPLRCSPKEARRRRAKR